MAEEPEEKKESRYLESRENNDGRQQWEACSPELGGLQPFGSFRQLNLALVVQLLAHGVSGGEAIRRIAFKRMQNNLLHLGR